MAQNLDQTSSLRNRVSNISSFFELSRLPFRTIFGKRMIDPIVFCCDVMLFKEQLVDCTGREVPAWEAVCVIIKGVIISVSFFQPVSIF